MNIDRKINYHMSNDLKWIFIFNATPIQIPANTSCYGYKQLDSKVYMKRQNIQKSQHTTEEPSQDERYYSTSTFTRKL